MGAIDAMQPCSLNVPPIHDRTRGSKKERTWEDIIAVPPLLLPDQQDELLDGIHLALSRLTERQQRVLRLRYGFDPGIYRNLSQDEAAHVLGLSSLALHALERQALQALRRQLAPVLPTEALEQQSTITQGVLVEA
jgi:RNA polymerase sigma factor (sigma-70 family)